VRKALWEQQKMRTFADDHAQRARIALLWALALDRFRDYVQTRRAADMSDQESTTPDASPQGRTLDAAGPSRAYTELDGVARGGGFGPPPPGEWNAEHSDNVNGR
jgi:hypothetical protein